MTTLSIVPADAVSVTGDQVKTTSLKVAEFFGKQHKHVSEKVRSLDCPDDFLTANFSAVKFEHRGNEYEAWEMTKDGFMFLVMGFTGKKAAAIKVAFINAFNAMAEKLKGQHRQSSTDERTGLRNAVNLLVSKKGLMYPDAYNLIHHRFNVEHLNELTHEQIPQAVEYVHRLVLEGEWLPANTPAISAVPTFANEQDANMAWSNLNSLCCHAKHTRRIFEEHGFRRFINQIDSAPGRNLIEHIFVAERMADQLMASCSKMIEHAKQHS